MKKSQIIFIGVLLISLIGLPFLGSEYAVDWMTKTLIYGIFALSLELLVGTTGLVCFGQNPSGGQIVVTITTIY